MIKCTKCKKAKNRTDFHKNNAKVNGYNFWCKECMKTIRPKYKANNDKERYRHLLKRYGISKEEYKILYKKQKGCCAICLKREKKINSAGKIQNLSVDHCHKSNKIRGLLCDRCNNGLGQFKDNINFLKSAIKYLNKH